MSLSLSATTVAPSAALESVLSECDERLVYLALDKYGGIRADVPDLSPDGLPGDLANRLREHREEIVELLEAHPRKYAGYVPFVALNLDSLWINDTVAPLTLFDDHAGRTFYRLTPRLWHFINAALDRAEANATKPDRVKIQRRRDGLRVQGWIDRVYRPDQIERAKRFTDILPTLRPGETLIHPGLIQRKAMASRNRFANGSGTPIKFPLPLWFDLSAPVVF